MPDPKDEDQKPDAEEAPANLFEDTDQTLGDPEPPKVETTDREQTRRTLALILIWTFSGMMGVAVLAAIFGPLICNFDKELLSETLKVVIPPTIALVGAVTGFYYGSERK